MNVGLIGLGFMGRGIFECYQRMEKEGFHAKIVAVCDVDPKRFGSETIAGNLDVAKEALDFSKYNKYTDYKEMIEKEKLDYIHVALPTYLHKEATVYGLTHGLHVICEKPMAPSVADCAEMIKAAEDNGKKLMIGQCLRFWGAYEFLKETVDSGKYGAVKGAHFFRGGGTPKWSFENWLLKKECGGGSLLDQHVHDVDTINWIFGIPEYVASTGTTVFKGSGSDIVFTHYFYDKDMVISAQDDWTLNGDFGFEMTYRVAFENANLTFTGGKVKVCPHEAPSFIAEVNEDSAYYRETVYFADAILNDTPIEVIPPVTSMNTIAIVEAETLSVDKRGEKVKVNK